MANTYRTAGGVSSTSYRSDRDGSSLKILAVEDSPSARKLFQGLLLRLGVQLPDLRFAANAPEALQLFAQWRPDLVFVDIELRNPPLPQPTMPVAGEPSPAPLIDGDELAKQLLERNPRLNLVVVTAFDRDNPRVKTLLTQGAADVIVKPVLAARVQEILERFGKNGAAAKGRAPRRV